MPEIKVNGFDRLEKDIADLIREMPELRREMHEQMAEAIKQEVDNAIASSLNDSRGHVRSWQEKHVGSGGGYAAVRPASGTTGRDSPGAITDYLNAGHRIRRPSGKSKSYRPRIHTPYVDGRKFYQRAAQSVEPKLMQIAQAMAEKAARKLGG